MSQATSGPSLPRSPTRGPRMASVPSQSDAALRLPKVRLERVGGEIALAIDPRVLCAMFGIEDSSVATRLLSQLVNIIEPDPSKPIGAASIDQVLALIGGIGPADTVEAMTATMLIGAQHAALDSLRRASHPDQTPAGRQSYAALGLKAMRTFAQLLDSLYLGRGKAVRQEISVTHQHVTVEAGGQAMVGAIDARRGRG
jgi:hypothetical protein